MSNYKELISDHLRASSFIIADGILPSGKQRGYILRRLIRRSLSACLKLKINILEIKFFEEIVDTIIDIFDDSYLELKENRELIIKTLYQESEKYHKSIEIGKREWQKILKLKNK